MLIIGILAGIALPVGAVEDITVNVTVSNTTEVLEPEDRTGGPGTGTGTKSSMPAIPEATATSTSTQPVTGATTNVSVTGTGSSPSVVPEVTVVETGTQVPVTEATPNALVTKTPVESQVNETFESSLAESEHGYYFAAERAMQSERSWGSTVSQASQDITPLWSNFRAKFSSPPAIADGIVYISSNNDGSFHEDGEYFTYVLDLHTGRFKQYLWGTGNDGRGGPTVDNGMVFVGNSNHFVFGYTRGTPGKLITKWWFPTGSSVATRPFVMNGVVYFSDYNKIYAITGTGKEQWSYDSCGPSCSAPQGANGVVYFSDNTKIYALNAITGQRIQNFAPDPIEFPTSPVLVNGVLYFGSGQNLYAIDATTGKKIWSFDTNGPIYHEPTVANGVVYIASDTHNFWAVNATTGQKIWKITKDFDVYTISAVADDVVYFGCEHDLWAVNAADGRTLWKYNFGDAWVGSPAIADGILVVGTDPGPVYAFDLSNTGLSGTPRSGNAPLTVQFTDTTAGTPTSWNWQFGDGGASSLQNPSHVYTAPGNYRVTLVTSGPTGSHTTVRDNYITVTGATSSNIAVFGNTQAITTWPSGTDYTRLGGLSAVRRDGTLDTFVPAPNLPGTDWVMVTNGAAIKTDGTLVTWTPGSTTPTYNPSGTGKKYVAVSQHRDWLLAIYEDPAGLTHLETLANPAAPPAAVSGGVPTGTGWKMIAAGNNHALALRTDSTLVAWGDNTYGQLDLSPSTTYHDIEAGDDFSIGLDPASAILTAGKDDVGQVSGKPAGTGYMAIDVGTATGAALTKNGTVVQWGQTMPGTPPPSDTGYTDVMLGPDYGFALRESVKEAAVTEPLSPGQSIRALDGTDVYIPMGASFDHTHNDVTRVFDLNGKQVLWANDENATQVIFPAGAKLPISLIHKVPSGSAVDGTVPYHATVSNPGSRTGTTGDVMSVSEDAWYDEVNPTLPRAMCFAGKGCSAGVTAKQQLFLSEPLAPTRGGTPVFSVHQTDNNTWVGTISILGSTNPADSTSMIMEKNNVDPDQAINFSVISGKWGNSTGTNVVLSAKANLTSENAVLQYSGVATASQQLKSMAITPKIWKHGSTEDVLVYTGNPTTCANTKECRLNGTFIPVWDISNVTATYFANVTTVYKLSDEMLAANGDIPGEYETIYETRDNIPVPEVVVTEPLSPLEPGKLMDAANANNTVPWGGTIEHVMDGDVPMTVVYNASGSPQFRADDRKAKNVSLSDGIIVPASIIFQVPSGSVVDERKKNAEGNISVVDSSTHVKILTITGLNNLLSSDKKGMKQPGSIGSPADYAYVEYAVQNVVQTNKNFDYYTSNWHVPAKPSQYQVKGQTYGGKVSNGTQIFIFNGIFNVGGTTMTDLFQPIIIHNFAGAGVEGENKWIGCVMKPDPTSPYMSDAIALTEGQEVTGSVAWDESNQVFWMTFTAWDPSSLSNTVPIKIGVKPEQDPSIQLKSINRHNVWIINALEVYLNPIGDRDHPGETDAGKSQITSPDYFPGNNIKFTNHRIVNSDGTEVTPSLSGIVGPWWSEKSGFNFNVEFGSNPYTITLKR